MILFGLFCLCIGAAIMALLCGCVLSEIQNRESVCYRPTLIMGRHDRWND